MADDADRATPNIENMIADGMARARRHLERNGQPTGLLPWQEGEWLNLNSK